MFQLTREQLEIVRSALRLAGAAARGAQNRNPNRRGNALVAICQKFIEEESRYGESAR